MGLDLLEFFSGHFLNDIVDATLKPMNWLCWNETYYWKELFATNPYADDSAMPLFWFDNHTEVLELDWFCNFVDTTEIVERIMLKFRRIVEHHM